MMMLWLVLFFFMCFCVVTGGFCAGAGDSIHYICTHFNLIPCFLFLLASLFNGMAISSSSGLP